MFNHICKFYFILDQPPVKELQTPVEPHDVSQPLSPLSAWMKSYIRELGKFLVSPAWITPESVKSFYDSPEFNMPEYLEPCGGWKTYNEFFARRCKSGYPPVAAIEDSTVIDAMARAGLPARAALTTQALIGLRRNYCEARKCLYCRMGHRLLQRTTR